MQVVPPSKSAAIAADVARILRERAERAQRKPVPRYAIPAAPRVATDRVFA